MYLYLYMQRADSASSRWYCNIPVFHYGISVLVHAGWRRGTWVYKIKLLPRIESVAKIWLMGARQRLEF